ncbi:peptidoglycan DD-metalloendopeptidase family protein [Streptomyces albidoflavus]
MPLFPNGTTTQPRISSPYGPRAGGYSSFHEGVDFIGYADVHAVLPGTVTWAGYINGAAGSGVIVVPDGHPNVEIRDFHADAVYVRKGARVAARQKIASVGHTGNATGDCDHFEIRVDGKRVDPIAWLKANGLGAAPASGVTVNRDVRLVQAVVGAATDGIYGPDTTAKVKAWQGARGLAADGVWGPKSDAAAFTVDGVWGEVTSRVLQYRLGVGIDGKLGNETYTALQRKIGVNADGDFGPISRKGLQRWLGVSQDGAIGPVTIKALQSRIFNGAI